MGRRKPNDGCELKTAKITEKYIKNNEKNKKKTKIQQKLVFFCLKNLFNC